MQNEAISKLQSEITESKNPAVQVIGQFLLQHVETNPEDAACILKTDKSIMKSLEAMRKVAEKKKVGNMAVLSDDEGFAIVLNYFKTEDDAALPAQKDKQSTTTTPQGEPTEKDGPAPSEGAEEDFDFDELLL